MKASCTEQEERSVSKTCRENEKTAVKCAVEAGGGERRRTAEACEK